MLLFFYSTALALAMAAWTLRYVIPMARARTLPHSLREKFGRVPTTLRLPRPGERTLWLHAGSVGEVLSASRLIAELGSHATVYLSVATDTAMTLALERFPPDRLFFMPFDFASSLRPYLRHIRPAAMVLIEGDIWPRMAHECRRANTPTIVVNARISDASFYRPGIIRWMWSRRFRSATLWLAQSEQDAKRLIAMDANPIAVWVGGNLKFDVPAVKPSPLLHLIRRAAGGRPIVVAGSTMHSPIEDVNGEEAQVLYAWMKGALPLEAFLIVAPRHPQRFEAAWEIVRVFPALRATELRAAYEPDIDILLLDTIGDLASVYSLADIAYVGGSLFPQGGHNPLEPARFGVPFVMGPSFESFREIVASMQTAGAICIVQDESELELAFEELLTDRDAARGLGQRGRAFFEQHQGATQRAVEAIVALLPDR